MVVYDLGSVIGPKGDKGDIGPQGPKGDTGPQGPKGDTGDIGPQGPKGDKGDTGSQGPAGLKGDKGDTGAQGPKGEKGDTGPIGPKGEKGDTGSQGPKGDAFTYDDFTPEQLANLKGPKGDIGPQGPQGEKGDTGSQGPQGLKGDKGDIGPQGPKGDTGPQGPKGDAFTFEDFTPEQLASLKGPKGDTGATGPQGPKGDTGSQGPQGDTGPQGPQGDTGPAGPKGEKGDKGDPGTITIDTSLSTTSNNAVQNKAITTAINSKADKVHAHNITDVNHLQTALDGKANTSHTHSAATLETDGFLSMQDKAKLDNLSYDTGWQEVTFKSGYARFNDSSSVYIRRKGDLVELIGVWKPTSKKSAASNPVPFASIPNKLKPTKAINVICPGQGKNTYMLTVDTDAKLKWSRYGVSTNNNLETGHFGNVHCMWII